MPSKIIFIGNRKYYFYDTFSTWRKAYLAGVYWRKKNKSNWFILKREGGMFNSIIYDLYLTKTARFL